MGFVVEPYSTFLCYEVIDLAWAKDLLPDGFEMVKTKIFADDEAKYYCIFGCFNVHTSAFWGQRMEFNVIARNKRTNLLSWVIIDYDTNTLTVDSLHGLRETTVQDALITTDYLGNIIVDITSQTDNKQLTFHTNVTTGVFQKLDRKLWLEGNLSVGYGRKLGLNSEQTFSLTFNEQEVEQALELPLTQFKLQANTWFPGLFKEHPEKVVCFPFTQHYLSDSPGFYSDIHSVEEMNQKYQDLDFNQIPPYTINGIKRGFLIGAGVSALITFSLFLWVLWLL